MTTNPPKPEELIGKLHATLELKTKEIAQLKKNALYIAKSLAAKQKDLVQLTRTKQHLELQLTKSQQTITAKEKKITDLASQNHNLVSQHEITKRGLEARLAALQQTITVKTDEHTQLAARNHKLQDQLRSLERDVVGLLIELQQLQEQSQAQRARIEQLEMQQTEQQRRAAKRAEQAHARPARARLRRLEQQTHAVEGVILHRREQMSLKVNGATESTTMPTPELTQTEQLELNSTLRELAPVPTRELEQAARLILKTMADEKVHDEAVEQLTALYLAARSPAAQAHIAGMLLKPQHAKLLNDLLASEDTRNLLGVRLKKEILEQIVAIAKQGKAETQAQLLVQLIVGGVDSNQKDSTETRAQQLVQLIAGGAGGGDGNGGSGSVASDEESDAERHRRIGILLVEALLEQDEEALISAIESDPAKVRAAIHAAAERESAKVRKTLNSLQAQLQPDELDVSQFIVAELKQIGSVPIEKRPPNAATPPPSATISVPRDYDVLAKQLLEPEFLTALGTSFVADSDAGPVLFGYYVSRNLPA